VLQTLSGEPDDRGLALHNRTHPLAVDRIVRLDAAMGTRFDPMTNLVDDLPSFVALRAPPPPAPLKQTGLAKKKPG
jgi:hypothetical protein